MFTFDEEMTDLLMGYCRWRLQIDPVPLDSSADRAHLAEVLEGVIKPGAGDAKALIDLFDHQIASAVVSVDSPRFLAFIPAAPTKASLLFDMVVSASSMQGTSWLEAAGAVAAENQVLELLADFAGLPKGAGGCFVSGGSLGNLSALVAARDVGIEQRGLGEARVRFAVSEEAHASVGRALSIIGAGALIVPTHDHRLTGKGLADALAADEKPETVVGVVATAGTTNAGIIDDLRGIGEVAKKNKLWFHVDAAYGGAGLLSSNLRPSYDGMELADSFIVDPHKWLFAPFDCCALIYRNPELARKVHTQHAAYLDITHEAALAEWNPADYAMHLAKEAIMRPIGTRNADPLVAELEDELYGLLNETGIGPMGLGGDVTVLQCHIEHADTHMTLNPVAVNYQCWAARRASAHISAAGDIVYDREA
jgi:glutamate/tyrosine decarboxylase-like PLP-dependent enzyme